MLKKTFFFYTDLRKQVFFLLSVHRVKDLTPLEAKQQIGHWYVSVQMQHLQGVKYILTGADPTTLK